MGCNVRLAGKLIGHDLRIMEVDEALAMNISYTPVATLIAEANARLKRLEEAKTSKEENEANSSTTIDEPVVEAPVEAPVEEQVDNVQAAEAPVTVPEEAKGAVDALKQAEADEKAKAVDEQNVKLGLQSQREEEQGILPENTLSKLLRLLHLMKLMSKSLVMLVRVLKISNIKSSVIVRRARTRATVSHGPTISLRLKRRRKSLRKKLSLLNNLKFTWIFTPRMSLNNWTTINTTKITMISMTAKNTMTIMTPCMMMTRREDSLINKNL